MNTEHFIHRLGKDMKQQKFGSTNECSHDNRQNHWNGHIEEEHIKERHENTTGH